MDKLKKILEHHIVEGYDNYGGEYRISQSDGVYTIRLTTYTIDDSDTRTIYKGDFDGVSALLRRNKAIGGFDVVAPRSMDWGTVVRYAKFGVPLQAKLIKSIHDRFGDVVFFRIDGHEYYIRRGQINISSSETATEWTSAPMLSQNLSMMEPMLGGKS